MQTDSTPAADPSSDTAEAAAVRASVNKIIQDAQASSATSPVLMLAALGALGSIAQKLDAVVAEVKGLRDDERTRAEKAEAGLQIIHTWGTAQADTSAGMGGAIDSQAEVANAAVPPIGSRWMGGTYAGVCRGAAGQPDYHLVLRDETVRPGRCNHAAAMAWAGDIAMEEGISWALPTRRESALLYAHLKDQFEAAWYWTSETHESDGSYAWSQLFSYGYQNDSVKSYEARARAVRRLPLQSFNPS